MKTATCLLFPAVIIAAVCLLPFALSVWAVPFSVLYASLPDLNSVTHEVQRPELRKSCDNSSPAFAAHALRA